MNLGGHDIGICEWSLPTQGASDLIGSMRQLGIKHVQVAIAPLLALGEESRKAWLGQLKTAGISITAGMIAFAGEDYSNLTRARQTSGLVPDQFWHERREMISRAAKLCGQFGIELLSAHVGFAPPSSDPKYNTMIERVDEVSNALQEHKVSLLVESGQQQASELLQFLNDVHSRNVCVNFDPANMILFGTGAPVEAVGILGRHIRHVHVKDAIASKKPGITWGQEVPLGSGQVPIEEFLAALDDADYHGPLVIERDGGGNSIRDVETAITTLREAAGQDQNHPAS